MNGEPAAGAALVAGSGAIGGAIALGLAERGFAVACVDRDPPVAEAATAAIRASGGQAEALVADLGDEDEAAAVVQKCVERFGVPYAVVHSLGIYPRARVADISFDDWRRVLRTNLDSAFLLFRQMVPLMSESGGGRILAITSGLGKSGAAAGAPYAASKAALGALVRSLATEVATAGIMVNCLAPGLTESPMMRASNSAEHVAAAAARSPFGRIGQPEDVVPLALFLLDRANTCITGQIYPVR